MTGVLIGSVPQFAQVMSSRRFWYLWSNMHIVENGTNPSRTDPGHDRQFKVRPMINKLQDTFTGNYYPDKTSQ